MRQLYFDYNATTPLAACAKEAMLPFLGEQFGSPTSGYALGRAAQEAIEDGRDYVALLIGCEPDEIVFTSGGTESNNLALKGLALHHGLAPGGHLIISAIEHSSVAAPARLLENLGFDLSIVPVTGQGVVQPAAIREAIRPDTLLVSITLANHEVGTIQPLKAIADVCHAAGVPLHTDAVQAAGKIRVQVDELDVDLLSLSAHKMYGPKGVGALYIRRSVALEPLLNGAGEESGLRSGTPNVGGIAAFGAAAAWTIKHLDAATDRVEQLRDRLLSLLREGVGDPLIIHGRRARRLPNTLSVSFPGVSGHEMLSRIPELAAATGSAYRGETDAISATLAAMGVSSEAALGTIRLSLGNDTTDAEVERAASLLLAAWEALRR